MKTTLDRVRTKPVTAEFRPNMGFKLMLTAEQKRIWAAHHKLRNAHERAGHPIRYIDRAANLEIDALRKRVRILECALMIVGRFELKIKEAGNE